MNKRLTFFKFSALVLMLFASLMLQAQTYPSPILTRPNTSFGVREYRHTFDSTIYIPTFATAPADTLDLHSQGTLGGKGQKLRMAALYFDSVAHILYVWDPALQEWIAAGAPGIYFGDETSIHLDVPTSTFSIKNTWPGQSSITTVGTITGGVWQSTPIADAYISSSAFWNAKLNPNLTSANIFVGNASNLAVGVPMTGDASLTNTGALALTPIITAGSCTNCNLTVDAKGRVTVYGNGTGGAGGGAPFFDSGALVKNFADATRKIRFVASLISTATTRDLYAPNTSGILGVVDGINGRMTYKAADGKIYTAPMVYDSAASTPAFNILSSVVLNSATSLIPLDTVNDKILVKNMVTGLVRVMNWPTFGAGGSVPDTLFVDEPGVGPGAIPLAFTSGGHLIIPKWAPGTNVSFSIAPGDSLVTINVANTQGIHGTPGNILYLASDGSAYTGAAPRMIAVDSSGNTLSLNFPQNGVIKLHGKGYSNGDASTGGWNTYIDATDSLGYPGIFVQDDAGTIWASMLVQNNFDNAMSLRSRGAINIMSGATGATPIARFWGNGHLTLVTAAIATLDSSKVLRVGGTAQFDGTTNMNAARFEETSGANVTAANSITLGNGNFFTVTGATQINAITTSGWQDGSKVGFTFTGAPLVKNNTAGAGGTSPLRLAGGVDYQAAAGDYIEFRYDATAALWKEVGRSLASSGGGTGGTQNLDQTLALGGALTANRSSNLSTFTWELDGSAQPVLNIVQSAGNTALNVSAIASSGVGVFSTVTNGTAVNAVATNGTGVTSTVTSGNAFSAIVGDGTPAILYANASTTNSIDQMMFIERQTTGTATSGIGSAITFATEDGSGALTADGQIIQKLYSVTAGHKGSQFIFNTVTDGVNSNTLTGTATIDGIGGITVVGTAGGGSFTGSVTGVNAVGGTNPIQAVNNSTSTNTVVNGIYLLRQGSYSGAVGVGIGVWSNMQNSSAAIFNSGKIDFVATSVTPGNEATDIVMKTALAGGETEQFRVKHNGWANFAQVGSFINAANNSAAISAGLATGDIYRNGDQLMIVH